MREARCFSLAVTDRTDVSVGVVTQVRDEVGVVTPQFASRALWVSHDPREISSDTPGITMWRLSALDPGYVVLGIVKISCHRPATIDDTNDLTRRIVFESLAQLFLL